MSEHSIDVDVNFNLGEISQLFEKMMEGDVGGDFFKELDKMDMSKGSLLHDISLTEDKTKMLEAFQNFSFSAPILADVQKMIEDMDLEQDDQSEIIQRTQQSMISMLSISKILLKMFEEKYPITKEMEKDLEDMNAVLADQSMLLDDKIEVILRSIRNIFAPLKEELPTAFKVTPTTPIPTFLSAYGREKATADVDVLEDFVNQTVSKLREIEETAKENVGQRIRAKSLLDELRNITNIGDDVEGVITNMRDAIRKMETGEITAEGYAVGQMPQEARDVFDQMELAMEGVTELSQNITVAVTEDIKRMVDTVAELPKITDELKNEIANAVQQIISASQDIRGVSKDVKQTVTDKMTELAQRYDEKYLAETIQIIWEDAIKRHLVQPIATTSKAKELEFILRIAEATLNTLGDNLERITAGKTDEQLKEMGATMDLSTIRKVIEWQRSAKGAVKGEHGILFPEIPEGEWGGMGMYDLDMVKNTEQMLDDISTRLKSVSYGVGTNVLDTKLILNIASDIHENISEIAKKSQESLIKMHSLRISRREDSDKVLSMFKQIQKITLKWDDMFKEDQLGKYELE